jgi:hypothetical protein
MAVFLTSADPNLLANALEAVWEPRHLSGSKLIGFLIKLIKIFLVFLTFIKIRVNVKVRYLLQAQTLLFFNCTPAKVLKCIKN